MTQSEHLSRSHAGCQGAQREESEQKWSFLLSRAFFLLRPTGRRPLRRPAGPPRLCGGSAQCRRSPPAQQAGVGGAGGQVGAGCTGRPYRRHQVLLCSMPSRPRLTHHGHLNLRLLWVCHAHLLLIAVGGLVLATQPLLQLARLHMDTGRDAAKGVRKRPTAGTHAANNTHAAHTHTFSSLGSTRLWQHSKKMSRTSATARAPLQGMIGRGVSATCRPAAAVSCTHNARCSTWHRRPSVGTH